MYALRKILSVLLVLLLIPAVMAQVAAHTARSLLVDVTFPQRIAREAGLYEQVEQILIDGMAEGAVGDADGLPMTRADVSLLVSRLLPAARLERIGDDVIAGLHAWALGDQPRPELTIDLSDVRAALPGVARELLEQKVEALPVCTREQLAQLAASGSVEGMPLCKTADPRLNAVLIDQAMQEAELDQFPDRVDLAALMEANADPGFWEQAWQALLGLRLGLQAVTYGWAVLGLLALLLVLLNLDQWYSPFGWLGAVALVSGGLVLLGSLAVTGFGLPAVRTALATVPEAGVLTDMLTALVTTAGTALRNNGFLVALVGLVAIIIAVVGAMTRPSEGAGDEQRPQAS